MAEIGPSYLPVNIFFLWELTLEYAEVERVDWITITAVIDKWGLSGVHAVFFRVARHRSRGSCLHKHHLILVFVLEVLDCFSEVEAFDRFKCCIEIREVLAHSRTMLNKAII